VRLGLGDAVPREPAGDYLAVNPCGADCAVVVLIVHVAHIEREASMVGVPYIWGRLDDRHVRSGAALGQPRRQLDPDR